MRRIVVTTLMLLASAPLHATDSLFCNGDTYTLDMSVGSDNIVDSATLRDERTKISTSFRLSEIENRKLIWSAGEGDYTANRLEIVLRGKDGQSYIVEAQGRRGVLRHKQQTYNLDCEWER